MKTPTMDQFWAAVCSYNGVLKFGHLVNIMMKILTGPFRQRSYVAKG